MRAIRQNYGMALGVNSVGLVLAAAGSINPIIAAVLHNLSTMLVIFNSARLIHYSPAASPNGDNGPPLHSESESDDYSGHAPNSSDRARNSSEHQELQ
jgi:hypothetical protein